MYNRVYVYIASCFWVRLRKGMDRLPRRTMETKKVYSFSTEVKSVLDRKHDKWSVPTAFERVKFDLNVLTTLCRLLMHFFREDSDNNGSKAACSQCTVAMFATLMKKAFKDDDFISGMYFLC